jgi:hypothetical protein
LGIGTNPIGTLTIASPASDGSGTFNQGIVFVNTYAGTWTHGAIWSVGSAGYNGSLCFGTDGDGLNNTTGITEKMRILHNGNVGIGTTNPAYKLHIQNSIMKKALLFIGVIITLLAFTNHLKKEKPRKEKQGFILTPAKPIYFNSFVDCNMAEAWIGDTFRIFPGKYGEDPLWGYAKDLKYADGKNAEAVFKNTYYQLFNPIMPSNVPVGQK